MFYEWNTDPDFASDRAKALPNWAHVLSNLQVKCNSHVWQYSSEEEEVDLQTALTGFQTKQRKVLEPVDHGKIEYESYRKNFYVEVPELAKMTQEGQ